MTGRFQEKCTIIDQASNMDEVLNLRNKIIWLFISLKKYRDSITD